MFGKHLVDQYAGESWDCAECVLRDPGWAFPSGILLHFYYSDGRINLFSIFLSPAQLHIIYCCVARGGWGGLVLVINQNRQCMCICGCKNNNKKMFLLFLPSLSIPTLRHFMKRQAWHDLRLRFVISHSFVAGQLYSMLPEEKKNKTRLSTTKSELIKAKHIVI